MGLSSAFVATLIVFGAATAPELPMAFAHADHHEQNCLVCHHNLVDDSGDGLCIDCHIRDAELRPQLEQQFHDLCRGCHIEKWRDATEAGPTRRCFDCHHEEELP